MSAVFILESVSYDYPGGISAVRDVSFTVDTGERLGLVGANGSGKSTLLHLMDGLCFPKSGAVSAFGETLSEEILETTGFGPVFRKRVGLVFQNSDAQLFCPTVSEELAFGPLQVSAFNADEIPERIDNTLRLLGIAHLAERSPNALSAGEKKMVALASVLIVEPEVLLLDEPTAGLDPRSQSRLVDILLELHEQGITTVTATHDLALLPHLADRVIVLGEDHGIAAEGYAGDLLENTGLLLSANLIHAHTHRHGALSHSHPHRHVQAHEHGHDSGA